MKKLPSIFKNENINAKDHNKRIIHIKEENINIEEELNKIFDGFSHPYNTKVYIKTINKDYETYLVSRTKNNIITLDNEVIPLSEIIYLKSNKKDFY